MIYDSMGDIDSAIAFAEKSATARVRYPARPPDGVKGHELSDFLKGQSAATGFAYERAARYLILKALRSWRNNNQSAAFAYATKAKDHLTKAISFNPDSHTSWALRGQTNLILCEPKGATNDYQIAMQLAKASGDWREWARYNNDLNIYQCMREN